MASSPASIRLATEADIPALLSLLLTSFRQFPLFSFLYSPLDTNKDAAHDTIFFWRRRLLRELLDPEVQVLIAEVERTLLPTKIRPSNEQPSSGADPVGDESWRMLDWVTTRGKLTQTSPVTEGKLIVGFAIWKKRRGEQSESGGNRPEKSWLAAMRTAAINMEIYFWNKVYRRQDQDLEAYAAYLVAEEELSQKFYAESCYYYLDNLCTDFRYQRFGIGTLLVEWGLARARQEGLPARTEAGPMGKGLYSMLGFQQIGLWRVPTANANGEQAYMELPVMERV